MKLLEGKNVIITGASRGIGTGIAKVFAEILDCHCFYNNHDSHGQQFNVPQPKLFNYLSDHIKDTKVNAVQYGFFSNFSRRIFFIQGIRNGLPNASKLACFAGDKTIKRLQRINAHILKPLWWSTNLSSISRNCPRYLQ